MRKQQLKFLFLTTLFLINVLHAQNKYNFDQFFSEAGKFYTQPFHWKNNDFLKLGIIVSATYGIMHLDETVRGEIQPNQTMLGSIPIEFGRIWGEPPASITVGGLLLLHGILTDNSRNKRTAFEIAESQLFAISITGTLKMGFGRARPNLNQGAFEYSPLHFKSRDYWSLPSGHTTMAFALSTTLAQSVDNDYIKMLFYAPALMTAFSRVYEDRHWASDVFLGACIGYFTAIYITELHKVKEEENLSEVPSNLINFKISF